MRKQLVVIAAASAVGCAVAPLPALAQSQAITNAPVYMYAGPAPDYPVVSQLPGNVSVSVMGCVAGYSWCDVVVPGARGWVYGGALYYPYQGSSVPALSYGAALGLPIVAFTLGSYWDSYYRDRPWFHDQGRWVHHAPPMSAPPPHFVGHPPAHGPVHGIGPGGRPGYPGGGPRPPGVVARPGVAPGHPGGPPPHGAPGHAIGRPPAGGPGHVGGRPPGGAAVERPGGRPPGGAPAGRPGGGGPPHGGGAPHGGGMPHGGGGRPGGGGPPHGGGAPHGGGGQHGGGGGEHHHP